MGRKCTCKNCGRILEGEDYKNRIKFNVEGKKTPVLVCTEKCKEEYIEKEKEKDVEVEKWKKVYGAILSTMGYRRGQVVPKSIITSIQDLRNGTNRFIRGASTIGKKEGYTYEVILEAIKFCEKDITYALSKKEFKTESSRVAYVMAILRNNLEQVHNNVKRDEQIKYTQDLQRESIEANETFDFMDSERPVEVKKTRVDLSEFFD